MRKEERAMNPPIETRKGVRISLWVAVALFLCLGVTGAALAEPVTFDLKYQLEEGTGTAVGTFTVDSSLLAPNVETEDLADLLCFQLIITVPGIPVQTFTKADIDGWIFETDGSGAILNVNFDGDSSSGDFFIWGWPSPNFALGFYDESATSPGDFIAIFVGDPEQGGVCGTGAGVPTLSLPGLVALMLLVGVAAALALRRGAILG